MEIREYIESGILETYVLGVATQEEVKELERLKNRYPEINIALKKLEVDLENIAQQMAITPPPGMWYKIEDEIVSDLIKKNSPPAPALRIQTNDKDHQYTAPAQHNFIEVEGQSSHMRVHKAWRWVLAAIFVLGKIFLALAIYYYLENRQLTQQLNELKLENNKK